MIVLVLFALFGLIFWIGGIFIITKRTTNPFLLFLKGALVSTLIWSAFLSPAFSHGSFEEFLLSFIFFPSLHFLAAKQAFPIFNFIGPVALLSFIIATLAAYAIWKKSKRPMLSVIIWHLTFLFLFLFTGDIYASKKMHQGALDIGADCYAINQPFSKSVFGDKEFRISHAEARKEDQIYLWSYKSLDYIPLPQRSGYRSYLECNEQNSLKP